MRLMPKAGVELWFRARRWFLMKLPLVISLILMTALLLWRLLLIPSISESFSVQLMEAINSSSNCLQETGADADADARNSGEERLQLLLKHWEKAVAGNFSAEELVPRPPHIEICSAAISWDAREATGKRPDWTLSNWRAEVGSQFPNAPEFKASKVAHGPRPPWITGADEDNLPMTRQVQTDLWLHQHPVNCSDGSVKFLVNDWVNSPRLGLGGQIVAMAGILAVALREKRVLVTQYFNRADHDECQGSSRGRWSCYFVPETSEECQAQARKLVSQKRAWKQGLVKNINAYPKNTMWFGKIPEYWGKPWKDMKPLHVVGNKLIGDHKAMDRQWWRAQAVRYFMRHPSTYLCMLLNDVRHQAFGAKAAELVLQSLPSKWQEVTQSSKAEDLWNGHKPWLPRPLLSIHVRQGDKASEMTIFEFKSYMDLARRIRERFPHIKDIWLSTEMQNVVDESKNYTDWNFYYTNVTRQNGRTSMGAYESSLGRKTSGNNAFVNFMMAADCDFFVGALGSTWSFLIDGMRVTGGKMGAAFLSVNMDRYW